MAKKIRVLIVEDVVTVQGLLKGILAQDPAFEVIGTVADGEKAVRFVASLHPDVVSMDIFMPVMDGVEATMLIMQQNPVPIVIVSSLYNPDEVSMSFKILEAGALTILPKPFGPGHPLYTQTAKNYRNTLKLMSEIKVEKRRVLYNSIGPHLEAESSVLRSGSHPFEEFKIIAIGASAGGPVVIREILRDLPKNFPLPILLVQHIDANFTNGFCDWLNSTSNLQVIIAQNRQKMLPGHVYMAPGDHHLGLESEGIISITKAPPEKGLRPAVSYLFNQVARIYKKNVIAILLSGMGSDGAPELKMLRENGAFTIAQDEATSLVHGMPGEAIRIGGACKILSPARIVEELRNIVIP